MIKGTKHKKNRITQKYDIILSGEKVGRMKTIDGKNYAQLKGLLLFSGEELIKLGEMLNEIN